MTKKTQMDETEARFTQPGRRLSRRRKTLPSHLKETTFEEISVKPKSEPKHISIRSKKATQTQKTQNKNCSKKKNTCHGSDTLQPKAIAELSIHNNEGEDHYHPALHNEEQDEGDLLTIKRRRLKKNHTSTIISEDDEKPNKKRRSSKLPQTNITIDRKEGEDWKTNSIDDKAKKFKSKKVAGASTMLNYKLGKKHSNNSLIDEDETKENLLEDSIDEPENIRKIEHADPHDMSNDNNDVSNQIHNKGLSDGEIHHEDNTISTIPINSLQADKTDWTIKVMVIRRGSIEEYSNPRGSGTRWRLILMDEQGTTIDAIAFNQIIDSMEQWFMKGRTYFLSNATPKLINTMYPHSHEHLEIQLTQQTQVEEATQNIHLQILPYTSVGINDLKDYVSKDDFIDVFGVVSKVYPIKEGTKAGGVGTYQRQNVILTNESGKTVNLTLWGDMAKIEGAKLEEIQNQNPIIGVFKVKVSKFKDETCIATTATSSIHINPPLAEAYALQNLFNTRAEHNQIDKSLDQDHQLKRIKMENVDEAHTNGNKAETSITKYKNEVSII